MLTAKRWLSLSVVAAGLGCLFACSYAYEVSFDVRLDPRLASRAGTVVLEASNDRTLVAHTPGSRTVVGVVGVCCSPEPVVEIRAFFDENGNQAHDPGEAMVAYPHNPVTLTGNLHVKLTLAPEVSDAETVVP